MLFAYDDCDDDSSDVKIIIIIIFFRKHSVDANVTNQMFYFDCILVKIAIICSVS